MLPPDLHLRKKHVCPTIGDGTIAGGHCGKEACLYIFCQWYCYEHALGLKKMLLLEKKQAQEELKRTTSNLRLLNKMLKDSKRKEVVAG